MCQCQFVSHVVTAPLQIGARALILSPTRELAMQTNKFIKEVLQFTLYVCTVIHLNEFNFALAKIVYTCCIKFYHAIS